MRVCVSVDFEGMPFINTGDHLAPGKPFYDEARRIVTRVVKAVVDEIAKHNVDEIVLLDSHGKMTNILALEIDVPNATIVTGYPRPLSMITGVESCDIVMFLGYHSKSNQARAVLDHTYCGRCFRRIVLNGIEASELVLNAAVAGHYDIPVVLVAGDQNVVREARMLIPDVETVELKYSISRYSAKTPAITTVENRLRNSVRNALVKKVKPFKLNYPVHMLIEMASTGLADVAEFLPNSNRVDAVTIEYVAKDVIEAYKVIELLAHAAIGHLSTIGST